MSEVRWILGRPDLPCTATLVECYPSRPTIPSGSPLLPGLTTTPPARGVPFVETVANRMARRGTGTNSARGTHDAGSQRDLPGHTVWVDVNNDNVTNAKVTTNMNTGVGGLDADKQREGRRGGWRGEWRPEGGQTRGGGIQTTQCLAGRNDGARHEEVHGKIVANRMKRRANGVNGAGNIDKVASRRDGSDAEEGRSGTSRFRASTSERRTNLGHSVVEYGY